MLPFLLAAITWATPAVTPPTVPATGHAEVRVEVEDFGRFALEVNAPRGTRVQLVDKMTGPGPMDGRIGEENGRLDVFLERGEVKLWLESADDGTGEAAVKATRFEELHGPDLPLLLEFREETGNLADKTQRSWWIDIPERRAVDIEAAARHLGDLRLWKDGTWLHPTTPRCERFEPVDGQPWRRCQLHDTLEPGLYRVAAYGGASEPWTADSEETPFWLRWGVPELGVPSETRITLDDKGYARFATRPGTQQVRLALPDNTANAAVGVGGVSSTSRLASSHSFAEITDESRTPEVLARANGRRDVIVQGVPGQVATLQALPTDDRRVPLAGGRGVLTGIVGAHEADTLEPTGLIYRRRDTEPFTHTLLHTYALELEKGKRYERRFNLLAKASLVVDVPSEGNWTFAVEGDAHIIVEPLLFNRPKRYRSPEFTSPVVEQALSPGLHIVRLQPTKPGIVTLAIGPNSWGRSVRNLLGSDLPLMDVRPVLQDLDLTVQNVAGSTPYLQWYGPTDVVAAANVRSGPVDLGDGPLSVVLLPREDAEVRVTVPERGVLTATRPDGSPLALEVEGTGWEEVAEVQPGAGFSVALSNPDKEAVRVSLAWRPHTHLPDTPPPPLTDEQREKLPEFEPITDAAPVTLDLDRTERRTFGLTVDEPGLYAVQSTGLLATSGAMRTRVRMGFADGNQNGVGRNFLVSRYLGSGDYQLTVQTQGRSRGHLGVELVRARQIDGGPLLDGEPARITLRPGDAVAYSLDVPSDGSYRIESVGLGRTFTCRIEDADGYPITSPPDQTCAASHHLREGSYTVVVAPERTESRRLTRAVRRADRIVREGHGPHPLRLDVRETHTWVEPADKEAERTPDTWTFSLPASASARIDLDEAMTAVLYGARGELGRVLPGQPFEMLLEPGDYRLEVRAARRDHGLTYGVRVHTWELLSGMERELTAPAEIPIGIGGDGALTVASFGTTDVRATLRDANGEVIAKSDDRPDDWNFRIESRVAPGTYTLEVDPVAGGRPRTRVRLVQPTEVVEPALVDGEAVAVVPGSAVHTYPVPRRKGEVVVAEAASTESLGVSLELAEGDGWRTLGTATGRDIVLPAWPDEGEVRVRLWSLDPRGAEATLTVHTPSPNKVGERPVSRGVRMGGRAALTPVQVNADAGVFRRVLGDALWQCDAAGRCTEVLGDQLPADALGLRVFGEGRLTAVRIAVEPGSERRVAVPGEGDRAVDVTRHDGPVVLIARSRAGTPVVRAHRDALDDAPNFAPVALGERATLAVDVDGQARYAQLRSGDGEALEARLSTVFFAAPIADKLPNTGRVDLALPAHGARRIRLGPGEHELRLTLDQGVAIALVDKRAVEQVLWADAAPRAFAVHTTAQELWVLHTGDTTASAVIRRTDGDADAQRIDATAASWSSPDAVTRVLTLAPGGDAVHVRGGEGRLLTARGHVVPLDGAAPGEGGTAWVRAEPGVGAVYKTPADEAPRKAKRVNAGTLALTDAEMHIEVQGVGLVELGLAEPAEVIVHGPSAETTVLPHGGWVRHVSDAPLSMTLRGLAGRTLTGTAEIRVTPTTEIGEGVGPEVLLGPGEARAFAFDVPRDGPIGLGVRASADRVEATLYASGEPLGTGLVQMADVAAGPHVLVLHLPSDAAPVRARPVLTGIEPPDTGPPEDVVRTYLELASEAP